MKNLKGFITIIIKLCYDFYIYLILKSGKSETSSKINGHLYVLECNMKSILQES
jgi:hypothetical protein